MLAFGRRYGLIGRNGTGKTTLLRAMAGHQIKGIPANCQILHVEQEVGFALLSLSVKCHIPHVYRSWFLSIVSFL
jgi:ATPase subunit of ABC transporter with duplicated ATPase domains